MKFLVAAVLVGVACGAFPFNMDHRVSPTQQFHLSEVMPGKEPKAPLDMGQDMSADMLMGVNTTIAGGGRESFFEAIRYIRNDTLVAERIDVTIYFVETQPPMTIVESTVNWHDFSYEIKQFANGSLDCAVGNPNIAPEPTDFQFQGLAFISYDKTFVVELGAARLTNVYTGKQGNADVTVLTDVYTEKPLAYYSKNVTSSATIEIGGYFSRYDTRPGVANQAEFTISEHLDCKHKSESMYEKEAHHLLLGHDHVPRMMRPGH